MHTIWFFLEMHATVETVSFIPLYLLTKWHAQTIKTVGANLLLSLNPENMFGESIEIVLIRTLHKDDHRV